MQYNFYKINSDIFKDGIGSYKCECLDGYSGKFCELAPISNNLYPNTSPCTSYSCEHVCQSITKQLLHHIL